MLEINQLSLFLEKSANFYSRENSTVVNTIFCNVCSEEVANERNDISNNLLKRTDVSEIRL